MAASDTVKNILCLGTEINEILETLIVRGQKSGEVRKEVVPVLTVYVLSTSIDSLLALAETKGKFGLSTLFQTNFFRLFFRYCTGV